MAQNPVPAALDALFTLAEDMADGAAANEVAIGIQHHKEVKIRADLAAARTAQQIYVNARTAKVASTGVQTVADSNGRAFINAASNVLSVHLGTQYSAAWDLTGFPNQSTRVPSAMAERQELLTQLQTYFTAHAAQEAASLNVTAALAGTRFTALSDARSAANAAVVLTGQTKALRDTAVTTLRTTESGLIAELRLLLADFDPRWNAFGLVEPGGSDLCPPPENLVLTPGVPGTVLADWSDTPRAVRYRVYVQIVGINPTPLPIETVNDSDATLSGLTTGQTIKVTVTAINADDDEGPPSAEIQIVVP